MFGLFSHGFGGFCFLVFDRSGIGGNNAVRTTSLQNHWCYNRIALLAEQLKFEGALMYHYYCDTCVKFTL